ncbi:MAG: dTMP kinase [Nitrospirae bacterium]|nr:dTMP kinase [Nitrospirota bacterium]
MRGFLTFEGIEGSGKSTQLKLLSSYLKAKGLKVLTTEEPGGTKIGLQIRGILLAPENSMHPLTELLLYNTSRAQHVREIIYPALMQGAVVICDRFFDSTVAYQGYGRGIEISVIRTLNEITAPDLKPFVTFLLDMDVEEGLRRNVKARKRDRLELETVEFHKRVREGYFEIAKEEPERVKIIDASGSTEEVHKKIIEALESAWL